MNKKVSRWKGLAALVLLPMALAGCGTSAADPVGSAPTAATAAGQPRSGGTLVYLSNTEPPTWDSFRIPSLNVNSINSSIFDTIIAQAEDGTYKPQLATSWEISDDATVFTLHLREGVTFHDGSPFNAAVLKQNFDRGIEEPDLSQGKTVKAADVLDEYTLQLTLTEPSGTFLHSLSTPHIPVYSGKVLSENTSAEIGSSPLYSIGTGPFKVASYEKGVKVVLERFEDYNWAPQSWGHDGPAYLDQVEVHFVPDTQSRVGSLNSGQAHAIDAVPPLNIAEVESAGNVILRKNAAGTPWYLSPNPNIAPFDDLGVRQAFRASIDLASLIKSVYGGEYDQAWSNLTPTTTPLGSYLETLEGAWDYDLAEANRLLEAAGYTEKDADGYYVKDGQRLHVEWYVNSVYAQTDQRDVFGEAITDALNSAGWEVVRQPFDNATHAAKLKENTHNLADASRGYADAATAVSILATRSDARNSADGINYGLVSDAQLDADYDILRNSAVDSERIAAARDAQQIAFDQAYIIPTYVPRRIIGTTPEVQGWKFDAVGYPDSFYDAWLSE
ncbi:MAG: ABC transporter substrate-binding protein [Propionibacteriaceae bacterium]|jgi:peptide/nickel transport system substrate-binding protein|nr:ABC transporter substrate-binding protein [Propionibacteriaceae bacterium]